MTANNSSSFFQSSEIDVLNIYKPSTFNTSERCYSHQGDWTYEYKFMRHTSGKENVVFYKNIEEKKSLSQF